MKRILLVIAVLLSVSALVSLLGSSPLSVAVEVMRPASQIPTASAGYAAQSVAHPLARAINLNRPAGDSLAVTIHGGASEYLVALRIKADGAIALVSDGTGPAPQRAECPAPSPEMPDCVMALRLAHGSAADVIVYPMDETVRISSITADIASGKQVASASSRQLLYGSLILLCLGPALVFLRRWEGAERIALAAIGLAWIAVGGWSALVIDLAFALAGFALLRWMATRENRTASGLIAACGAVALILVFVKFVAPSASGVFANPGGFWLTLPLGISYFAIRLIDLMIAVHAGKHREIGLRDYLAFLFMPHTLPAGPLMTYQEFLSCRTPAYGVADFGAGTARMAVGMTKKVLADAIVLPFVIRMTTTLLEERSSHLPLNASALLIANTAFVYLDFSAYCDIAIGAARAGGYRLPENFNWPLLRSNMRQFWKHWHMTLTSWVMRRVYFPAFLSSRATFLSMLVSMLIIGLWHAPVLPWALWAVHHASAMAAESRLFPQSAPNAQRAATTGPARRAVSYVMGLAYVWIWVALGHSFTLFSNPAIALQTYGRALLAPLHIFGLLRW